MKTTYTKELGERLGNIRKEREMSQEYVADRMNITRSAICKYESGDREIRMTEYFKLCDIYNVDAYALLDEVRKYVYKK